MAARLHSSDYLTSLDSSGTPNSKVTFLCGAGISYPAPTALPTVNTFIDKASRYCSDDPALLKSIAGVRQHLQPPPRFEVLVDSIGQLRVTALSVGSLFDSDAPNALHRFFGSQCRADAALITTNFDNCIERALPTSLTRVIFHGTDLDEPAPTTSVIVKPHGSNPLNPSDATSDLVVSIRALARTAKGFRLFPRWRDYLHALLQDRVVIVVGYSGSDDFDITPILLESKPDRLVWVDYAADGPPRVADATLASESVRHICSSLNATYMRGDFASLAPRGIEEVPFNQEPSGVISTRLETWLESSFATDAAKQALLCLILRHYSLHDLTVVITERPLSADAVLQRGAALYYRGCYAEACDALEQIDRYCPADNQQAQAAFLLSSALSYSGEIAAAKHESDRHINLAEQMRDIGELQTALNHGAALAYSRGERREARQNYKRVLAFQDEYPSLQAAAMATWGLGDIANVSGHRRKAIREYSAALELCRQLGSAQGVAWMSANLGEVWLQEKAFAQSAAYLEEAVRLFTKLGVAAGFLFATACHARLEYSREHLELVPEIVRRCLPLLSSHLDSPAISIVVALSYVLARDLNDPGLLAETKVAAEQAVCQAAELLRSGEARQRWELCRQVLNADGFDERLYRACRMIVIGGELRPQPPRSRAKPARTHRRNKRK